MTRIVGQVKSPNDKDASFEKVEDGSSMKSAFGKLRIFLFRFPLELELELGILILQGYKTSPYKQLQSYKVIAVLNSGSS